MFNITAELHHKNSYTIPKKCAVDKVVTISNEEFKMLNENLLGKHYDFIHKHKDLINNAGNDGLYHCILYVPESGDDGILVNCEGYDYARYSAYLPNAKQIIQEHEPPKLADLLNKIRFEDVHLVHSDIDMMPATIVELDNNTLTDEGRQDWSDVLNGNVKRVFHGIFGVQIEMDDVDADRLLDFSKMLAGHCPCEDYDRWITTDKDEQSQEQIKSENEKLFEKYSTDGCKFYLSSGGIDRVYFNPDSNAGGQFVHDNISLSTLVDAFAGSKTEAEFWEHLDIHSNQYLTDIDTPEFKDALIDFAESPCDFEGETEETMESLRKWVQEQQQAQGQSQDIEMG